MKKTKRLAALMLAVVMVFALGSTALADEPGVITGTAGEIPVNKHITMTNNTDGTYYSPHITFSYAITPATDPELAYQPTVGGATILKGVDGGLIGKAENPSDGTYAVTNTASDPAGSQIVGLEFKSHAVEVDADSAGADIVETMTLSVVANAFPHAGVYRYKVADNTSFETIKNAGLERPSDYSSVFFVDVYIKNADDGSLEPAGAVVSTYDPSGTHNVPVKDSNGNYIQATPTTNGAGDGPATPYDDGQTFSPNNGYRVDEDGKLYKLNDGKTADDEPENPDYTDDTLYTPVTTDDPVDTQVVCQLESGSSLVKDGDGINEEPKSNWTDGTNNTTDDDKDDDGKPSFGDDDVEPVYDDEGNIVDTDGNVYPRPDYAVDPTTGKIYPLSDSYDPDATGANVPPKYPDDYDTSSPVQVGDPAHDAVQAVRPTYTYDGDVYNTYNVTLKKIVAGSMGDKEHEFQFNATVGNNGLKFKYQDAEATSAADGESGTSIGATLNHEEVLNIRGLNPRATVLYTETNNTNEVYTVSAADKAADEALTIKTSADADATEFASGNKAATGTLNVTTYASAYTNASRTYAKTDDVNITYTNTLDQVSPTGIALRYAPYIFMLAAASMFVVLSRKERDTENA